MLRNATIHRFQHDLLTWYSKNKRCFPWRETRNPYNVLISEVLLQKTNSRAVGSVYNEFIHKYPTPLHVTKSTIDEIYQIVSPLGLHYRAERIFLLCNSIVKEYKGKIPNNITDLMTLKGIGRYAASAVLCFGFGYKIAILDQNVIRILSRVFNIRSYKPRPHTDRSLWQAAEDLLPENKFKEYNYALLDLSALICKTKPDCDICPLVNICYLHNR